MAAAAFLPHILEHGYDTRTTQAVLGRRDVNATTIDVHVLSRGPAGVRLPPIVWPLSWSRSTSSGTMRLRSSG